MNKRKRMRELGRRVVAMLFVLAILLGPIGPVVIAPRSRAEATSPDTTKIRLYCWTKEGLRSLIASGQRKRVLLKYDSDRLFNVSTFRDSSLVDKRNQMMYAIDRTSRYTETQEFWGKDGFFSMSDFYAPTMWKIGNGLGIQLSDGNCLTHSGNGLAFGSSSDEWTLYGDDSSDYTFRCKSNNWYLSMFSHDHKEENSEIYLTEGKEGLSLQRPCYTGVDYQLDMIHNDFTVENNQITTLGKTGATYIPSYVTLTVEDGGILTVAGSILNDGKIVVKDGGLLILKENSLVIPFQYWNKYGGYVTSEGSVIVRSGAMLVGGGYTGLNFSSGAVINYGYIAADRFTVSKAYTVDNRKDATVIAGYSPTHNLHYKLVKNVVASDKPAAASTLIGSVDDDFETNWYLYPDINIAANGIYGSGTLKKLW